MAESLTPMPMERAGSAAGGDRLLAVARRAAAGDGGAMAALYEARFEAVFVAARRASGRDEAFCLDVVQEAFVRVMRSGRALASLRDEEHLERWLVRVAQTTALDLMRRERRRVRREAAAAGRGIEAAEQVDRIGAVERELAGLPAEDRALLRLRWSGMTLGALAEMVGATTGAVHGRLRRTMEMLRRSAQEVDDAE